MPPSKLYSIPSEEQINASEMQRFISRVQKRPGCQHINDYWCLHAWSIADPAAFWDEIWDWGDIIGSKGNHLFDPVPAMSSTGSRLPSARLNYAENVLLSHPNARSAKLAVATVIEAPITDPARQPVVMERFTFEELYQEVLAVSESLRRLNVGPGDGVGAYSPSNSETAILMLATSVVGAVWSAVAAEAGPKAALERLEQTKPKVILAADFIIYNGKKISLAARLNQVIGALGPRGLKHVVVVGQLSHGREPDPLLLSNGMKKVRWHSWNTIRQRQPENPASIAFWRGPAMAPLWVLFSSGTTGQPKAIVHHVGGMLLAQKMTNRLHHNVGSDSVCFQFTTPGWMMWNVALSMVAMGSSSIFFDGSPLATQSTLWHVVDKFKCTYLGCSPRYLQILHGAGFHPKERHSLKSLKTIQVAGAPLSPELYDFVRSSICDTLYLNNASGGTDICGCFVGSSPTLPVYYGEITVPILGMAIEAWDEEGKRDVQDDPGDERYKSTYFADYPGAWNQSDWIEITEVGGILMLGRSDGVLNPQGVRFGSAELYAVMEEFKDAVDDCIAVGQKNAQQDERVVLFVKPVSGARLDHALIGRLKDAIAVNLSRRHVPAKFIECPEIPYTHTLKRVEVAVKKLVNGTPLGTINTSAISNPESLGFFVDHPQLRDINTEKSKL